MLLFSLQDRCVVCRYCDDSLKCLASPNVSQWLQHFGAFDWRFTGLGTDSSVEYQYTEMCNFLPFLFLLMFGSFIVVKAPLNSFWTLVKRLLRTI